MSDIIAAVATARGRAALGIIRLSGEGAAALAEAVFRPQKGGLLRDFGPHRLVLGEAVDEEGRVLDQVLCTYALAPRSFTGEDTAEFQCHGSPAALQELLHTLLRQGARMALPGEFSRRAFLNGRLDLSQAEAIMDLIDAETPLGVRNAAMQLRGAVTQKTEKIYDLLLGLLAHFQAVVDYPEEGVEPLEAAETADTLAQAAGQLGRLRRSFERGKLMKEGVKCAILGKPNAGKSSLLNALLGYERAIVTDEAGTTRDTLEEKLSLGGLLLRLTDTAGLRETSSAAEAEGVRRARAAAGDARLVLAVFDGSAPLGPEDEAVIASAKAAPAAVALLNKEDLPRLADRQRLEREFDTVLSISARTGAGLEELERALEKLLGAEEPLNPGEILTNERQYDAIFRAEAAVKRASEALRAGFTPDAVLTDAEEALAALGEVSGRTLREDLVEAVFSRFCVGK